MPKHIIAGHALPHQFKSCLSGIPASMTKIWQFDRSNCLTDVTQSSLEDGNLWSAATRRRWTQKAATRRRWTQKAATSRRTPGIRATAYTVA